MCSNIAISKYSILIFSKVIERIVDNVFEIYKPTVISIITDQR